MGPGKAVPGFLNADQKFNRDLTLTFLNTVRPSLYLDGFSATGIRGLRAELELGLKAVMVERSRKSFQILKRNAERNGSQSEIYNDTFESILSKYRFDFIDIDPFGDVVPYVDISLRYVRNDGYIGFTATDLSVLTGSLKDHNLRRYGSVVMNNAFRHEMGIRNLLGFIARRAVTLERGIEVLLSLYHGHFYRIIIQVRKGTENAESTLRNIAYFNPFREIGSIYGDFDYGPLWIGNIEGIFSRGEIRIPKYVDEETGYKFNHLKYEDMGIFFVDIGDIFSKNKMNLPSMTKVKNYLDKMGIENERTHFSNTGLKVKDKRYCMENIIKDYEEIYNSHRQN
ncbi:N2,N2-dimethylguanosine tRNA methyltransferase [Cuniculiplasma sp. SKW3]|uniref:N2,N2-dimethylguanosine tRNA methyltransferase n=1 Tax=Cuniculiplasma sp. SKW3 TaxID=3400170 RepID=UPI003FD18981